MPAAPSGHLSLVTAIYRWTRLAAEPSRFGLISLDPSIERQDSGCRFQPSRGWDRARPRDVSARPTGDEEAGCDQRTHYVVLDDTCIRLLNDWLHERGTRWPATSNPHLFVTRITATDPRDPPPSRSAIVRHFHPTGLSPAQLRTDRILYEAAQGADPVLVMRLFCVCNTTAMKYVNTTALTRSRDPIAP
jgi:hypothetical protein